MGSGGSANARPWQIAVFAVALVAICGSLAWSLTRGPKVNLDHRVILVDMTSGALFDFSTRHAPVILPELHPDTGKPCLLPATEAQDGTWFVDKRFLVHLRDIEGEPVALVNQETGEVRVAEGRPRQVSAKQNTKKHLGH